VVRQWGGETTIEGVKVKIYDENLRPLPLNTQLLLFLVYDRAAAKYDLFDRVVGAFELSGRDNRLRHLLTPSPGSHIVTFTQLPWRTCCERFTR
jgi:hypothetical protein